MPKVVKGFIPQQKKIPVSYSRNALNCGQKEYDFQLTATITWLAFKTHGMKTESILQEEVCVSSLTMANEENCALSRHC